MENGKIEFHIKNAESDPQRASIEVAMDHILLSDIGDVWGRACIVAETLGEPLEVDGKKLTVLPMGQAALYGAVMYILGNRGI